MKILISKESVYAFEEVSGNTGIIRKFYERYDFLRYRNSNFFKDDLIRDNYTEKEYNVTFSNVKLEDYKYFSNNVLSKFEMLLSKDDNSLYIWDSIDTVRKLDCKYDDIVMALVNNDITLIIANILNDCRDYLNTISIRNNKDLYKHYRIPKKEKGKFRDIYEPIEILKEDCKILNKVLQSQFNTKQKKNHTNQYAYIEERGIVDNAKIHRDNKNVVKLDLNKFFDTTKFEYVKNYIKYLCKDELLLEELGIILTNKETGGLFMGNPVSGTLTNILMYKVSRILEGTCNKRGYNVSIYADDITISTNNKISKEAAISIVNFAIEKSGLDELKINPDKTKKVKNQNRRICGVTINHENKLTVKRKDYENLRVMLYKLSRNENINIPIPTLIGKINFYLYVDETGKFKKLLNKYSNLEVLKNQIKL